MSRSSAHHMGRGDDMAESPLALKLSSFMSLDDGERSQIRSWCSTPTHLPNGAVVIHPGGRTTSTCLVLSGWTYRFKDLCNGQRIIVGLMLPGDMCNMHGFLLRSADHGIATLSDAVVALIPSESVSAGIDGQPRLGRALWWSSLVDESITREWLVNVSQRSAAARLAHLFCELWLRARRVGLTEGSSLLLPLRQIDLADAVGLTPVHVSRIMRTLREDGLVTLRSNRLGIPDLARLAALADFDPSYLELRS